MNKIEKLVLQILKPKTKSLGFNAAELKTIAEHIAKGIKADDDAEEDDIKQDIETAVEAALPFLEAAQKNANRIIEEHRKKNKPSQKSNNADDDDEDEDDPSGTEGLSKTEKLLLKKLESMEAKLEGFNADRVSASRRKEVEKLVKEAGKFGKRILKDFDGRKFKDDDEFNEYLEEIKTDCEEYAQEMADAGLEGLVGAGKGKREKPSKEITDDEVKALVDTF